MPEVVCYAKPHSDELFAVLAGAVRDRWTLVRGEPPPETAIYINGSITPEQIAACPNLRALIIPFAGVPARTRDLLLNHPHIAVHNLHHNAPETAEVALALMLAVAKNIPLMHEALRRQDWSPGYDENLAVRLEGKTALIIGFGRIGHRIARGCLALGMDVIVIKRSVEQSDIVEYRTMEDLHRSLAEADIIHLAAPATPETQGMLGPAEFAAMKPGAILVNIARAALVDEDALFEALQSGRLRGAGIDVWYRYPASDDADAIYNAPFANRPFHELPNVVLSPHRGGASAEVEEARVAALAELLTRDPMPSQVDLERGY